MSNEMLSLYDYLGRAAGDALGWAVAKHAHNLGAEINQRHISNPRYTGVVNLYTEELLDSFFKDKNYATIIKEDEELYNRKKRKNKLPF